MKNQLPIAFSLQFIQTEQFAFFEENYHEDQKDEIQFSVNFKLDTSNNLIGVFVSTIFEQNKTAFLKIEISCHFQISPDALSNFMNADKTKTTLPKNLATHLAVLSAGTLRGILFAKTEHLKSCGFVLPTINMDGLINEDPEFIAALQ